MIERVLENWLDNATERTFQVPFCHMLQAEGYTVLHLSRHCAMEMGKDIIAIDKEGVPCAFQLKSSNSKKISLSQWREEIAGQIQDLVCGRIVHPSINCDKPHRSFLVTNKELDEEVSRAIDDHNAIFIQNRYNKLETLVRGQLIEKARSIGLSLWPAELSEIKTFLEIYLLEGNSLIPKEKLATLFSSILYLREDNYEVTPPDTELIRHISSCALLCASAISSFSNKNNYVAEIEAWTIFVSYVYACCERWSIDVRRVRKSIDLAYETIYSLMTILLGELKQRKQLIERDVMTDVFVYRLRITYLVSLMSVFFLWKKVKEPDNTEDDDYIMDFIQNCSKKLELWGEAAIPQFLSYYWYRKRTDATPYPDFFLTALMNTIISSNLYNKDNQLANPYYNLEKIAPQVLGLPNSLIQQDFKGSSYTLEGIMQIFVRRNWKNAMKVIWPSITMMELKSFFPDATWKYYLWHCKKGINISLLPPYTKQWNVLKAESYEDDGVDLPELLKTDPCFFLLFSYCFSSPNTC